MRTSFGIQLSVLAFGLSIVEDSFKNDRAPPFSIDYSVSEASRLYFAY
ncbi:hypothetical protein LEP1GSC050_2645 [Leptospira broomii serovar Hurstbridge str. 5399]|uniref:Uncharacterized protein n=1 Tax=Leptospira broomii serovar Hurstbridge str. 5399 TaxID=1049789 RepID=T0FCA0_9LEPT|nr:hypothetical protein LEP1GSC050_2645 [Leptospira broomii serovar Hurstbridge str. 5399]